MKADVVVFDPATVKDLATYEKPDQYSQGIAWVLVNGNAVVADCKPTNALPGRVLHGPGYKPGTPKLSRKTGALSGTLAHREVAHGP